MRLRRWLMNTWNRLPWVRYARELQEKRRREELERFWEQHPLRTSATVLTSTTSTTGHRTFDSAWIDSSSLVTGQVMQSMDGQWYVYRTAAEWEATPKPREHKGGNE